MFRAGSARVRAAVGALALAVFPFSQTGAQTTAREITIPVILPLSGPAAFLGQQSKQSFDAGEALANRRGDHIRLAYYDDTSNPQVAVQLMTQLESGGARVVLGPSLKATCGAVDPLVKTGPLEYCLSPTMHPPAGSYVFTAGTDTWDLDKAVVRYARLMGWKRVALIVTTDASGIDAQAGFHAALSARENRGMNLVAEVTFNPSATSVMAELARIKAARPDVLLAWASGAPIATILRQLNDVGLDVPVATAYSNLTYRQMQSMAGFMPRKGLFFPVPSPIGSRWEGVPLDPRTEAALKESEAAFAAAGLKPDAGVLTAWDPLMLVVRAYHDLGPDATAVQLHNYLVRLRGFAGIEGLYDFLKYPQRGLGEDNSYITKWSPDLKTWEIVSKAAGVPLESSTRR